MTLNILYIGDIMGRPGRDVVRALLPTLRNEYAVDVVIAQAENVSHGKSISVAHYRELQACGIDGFSGGNHTTERQSVVHLLNDPEEPIVAPLNQAGVQPAWGAKIITTPKGKVLFASVLGAVFPPLPEPPSNPLQAVDEMLAMYQRRDFAAIICNFHGDYSSEKRVFGYYLDGRVTAVIGDHWHVPTADAMVLPGGTAHMTDVGMVGTLHSSLGVELKGIIARWRDGAPGANRMDDGPPYQFNAVLISCDAATGLAKNITPINKILPELPAGVE